MGGSDDDIDSLVRAVAGAPAATPPMRRQTTPKTRLARGDVLGGRFELQALAGRGGMGEVWKSLDRESGATVAVKRIGVDDASSIARFEREARLLAAIDHPTVVRHVGHGIGDGEPWMAMEWLDGRDLASHLLVEQMSMTDTCRVGARVAEALACVHGLGIIHRDVKPSNIFLVGGDPATAKLLDLGIARSAFETSALTATHAVVGSVGYIAPEQARAVDDLDVRADLFSLGCVLYECVTGAPAFAGKQAVAALLKVMWDEVPRLSSVRAGVPRASRRPRGRDDGKGPRSPTELGSSGGARAGLARPCRRDGADRGQPSDAERATRGERDPGAPGRRSARSRRNSRRAREPVRCVDRFARRLVHARQHGVRRGSDGSGVSLRLSCTRTSRSARRVDRARDRNRRELGSDGAGAGGRPRRRAARRGRLTILVVVDDVTEGLLGDRFEIEHTATCHVLLRTRAQLAVRTLLGKPTPTVGRERELAMLGSMWTTCMEDRVASAAVVVAGPGMGKSRVRYELEQRIRAQSPDVNVLLARADPFAAGSALRLSREIVRAGMGLHDVPDALLATTVHARVTELCGDDADRIAEIITEMIGVANDAPSPRLVAARQDPTVMRDEVRRAVVLWLKAEAQRAPILLMLEDLHWGDPGSVEHVDDLLRVRDLHVMVLAMARPEVRELFPALWQRAAPVTIELGPLTAKAAERLVTTVLGDRLQPTRPREARRARRRQRVLSRGAHPLCRGRSIRRTARDRACDGAEPLRPPRARPAPCRARGERVRRARVGRGRRRGARSAMLAVRSTRWSSTRSSIARRVHAGPGLVEYIFRHALIQDAVYAMLTEHDRVAAHRAAAMWMVSAGDTDALAIAEHFERGGTPAAGDPVAARGRTQCLGVARYESHDRSREASDRAWRGR